MGVVYFSITPTFEPSRYYKCWIVCFYYKYFFKTWRYIQSLNRNLEGIRDGKMISYSQFSSVKVPYPRSFKEQQKMSHY